MLRIIRTTSSGGGLHGPRDRTWSLRTRTSPWGLSVWPSNRGLAERSAVGQKLLKAPFGTSPVFSDDLVFKLYLSRGKFHAVARGLEACSKPAPARCCRRSSGSLPGPARGSPPGPLACRGLPGSLTSESVLPPAGRRSGRSPGLRWRREVRAAVTGLTAGRSPCSSSAVKVGERLRLS